jgi:hypothetical protein
MRIGEYWRAGGLSDWDKHAVLCVWAAAPISSILMCHSKQREDASTMHDRTAFVDASAATSSWKSNHIRGSINVQAYWLTRMNKFRDISRHNSIRDITTTDPTPRRLYFKQSLARTYNPHK